MAKMFEVKTMNGSLVMPKMAGTLSTANSTSVLSITSSTRNSGVMHRRPFSTAKKRLCRGSRLATGNSRLASRSTRLFSGGPRSPLCIASLTPV